MKATNTMATLTATLITFGSLVGGANAAITVSGLFSDGSADISITQDITYTVTVGGVFTGLVLDEWLTYDGSQQTSGLVDSNRNSYSVEISINGMINQLVNGWSFVENHGLAAFNDLTINDGYFAASTMRPTLMVGDTITIRASTWDVDSISGFNQASVGTFSGDTFLISSNGTRLTNIVAVPEPSASLLLGLGALGLVARRKRTS
mgnify:CR=1 FL=1